MRIINCDQGTPEWFACRLGKFTASDAQTIGCNGKGLETLVYEKLAEIITGKPKESYSNDDIERGHQLEMEARDSYTIDTGNTVECVGFCELDEYTGASPDGFVNGEGLVEIKCPNNVTFVRYMIDKKIDPKYYSQMQMQMYVTDRRWCDYVVYNPNFPTPVITRRVERDELSIEKIKLGIASGIEMLKNLQSKL